MPHDRLRFAWIPPPTRGWIAAAQHCARDDNHKVKGPATNASPGLITSENRERTCTPDQPT